jgi:hypothetical protein
MRYRVHRLQVTIGSAQERLEEFLNKMEGDALAVIPYIKPTFRPMGATARVDFFLIVERVK